MNGWLTKICLIVDPRQTCDQLKAIIRCAHLLSASPGADTLWARDSNRPADARQRRCHSCRRTRAWLAALIAGRRIITDYAGNRRATQVKHVHQREAAIVAQPREQRVETVGVVAVDQSG